MAKVDANSDDLKAFAKELQRFEAQVAQEIRQVRSRLSGVDWRDKERQRFEADLDQMLKAASKALTPIGELTKSLNRKAAELDRYLGR
jgi:uncharacterized protein YukE